MSGTYPALKFAAFAVVCAVFAVWIVTMIGNLSLFESHTSYEAVFDDATGLLENDEVRIAGVPVGRVDSVTVERGRAVARFSVRDDVELGQDTTVGIRWRGVIGLRYLYVYPDGDGALEPDHRFPPERTFGPASIAVALERITPVMRSLEPEVQNLFLEAMEEALVGREEEIQSLIHEAGSLTQTLAGRDEEIGRILDNAAVLMDVLAERDDDVRAMFSSFAESAELIASRNDRLEAFIVQLADTQSEFRRLLEANEGEIRGVLAELDDVLEVLSAHEDELEDVLKYSGEGIVSYHKISRWGQFFNVRFVGVSASEDEVGDDGRGAELPPRREFQDTSDDDPDRVPDPRQGSGSSASMAGLFGSLLHGGGDR